MLDFPVTSVMTRDAFRMVTVWSSTHNWIAGRSAWRAWWLNKLIIQDSNDC